MPPNDLKSIFGSEEIGDLVKRFNFDQNERGMFVPFAPLYYPLDKSTMEKLKPEEQIMIAAAARTMQKLDQDYRSYDSVLGAFMQNAVLQMESERNIIRSDTLHSQGTEALKSEEVHAWFAQLVKDEEVLRTVGLGADAMAKVVARSGASDRDEQHEKVFDTTFLNFPDPAEPYFKLQNVRLTAWSRSDRMGFMQQDLKGITGEYKVSVFTYRDSVISTLSETARSKALELARGLFE